MTISSTETQEAVKRFLERGGDIKKLPMKARGYKKSEIQSLVRGRPIVKSEEQTS